MTWLQREVISTGLITFAIVYLPIALSNAVQRKADHMRLTAPDKLYFRAAKWTYLVVVLCGGLLSVAFLVFGYHNPGAGAIYKGAGIISAISTLLAVWEIQTTRVIFEEDGFWYIKMFKFKKVKVNYAQIDRVYASNGFIVVKFADNKGIVIDIMLEEPAKLMETIKLFSWKAKLAATKECGNLVKSPSN